MSQRIDGPAELHFQKIKNANGYTFQLTGIDHTLLSEITSVKWTFDPLVYSNPVEKTVALPDPTPTPPFWFPVTVNNNSSDLQLKTTKYYVTCLATKSTGETQITAVSVADAVIGGPPVVSAAEAAAADEASDAATAAAAAFAASRHWWDNKRTVTMVIIAVILILIVYFWGRKTLKVLWV
jgi:hypothetical protein